MNKPATTSEQLKRALLESRTKKLLASRAQGAPASIMPAARDVRLPLSWAQQRLWVLDQLDHDASVAYLVPAALRLSGALDKGALKTSLDRIVARHENLRTNFVRDEQGPIQVIAAADAGFQLEERDLRSLDADAREQAVQAAIAEQMSASFDLAQGRLIRGMLLCVSDSEHVLCVTQHHIISDGWSRGVFVREIFALYAAFSQGQADPLPALPLQYADYAVWQRGWLQGETLQKQRDFWSDQLAGAPALLELPADRPRPAHNSHAGAAVGLKLPAALTESLKALSQQHGTTLFMTLLAGWSVLMARMSGQDDVVTGTPVANRQRRETEGLIGFFVNTLALRVSVDGDASVAQLLEQVKTRTLGAYSHQDLPFEQVVEVAKAPRSMAHNPVFQVMLTLNNTPAGGGELSLPGLTLAPCATDSHAAQFDLNLALSEGGGTIHGTLEYATALFDQATVERYASYFRSILEAMVADPQQSVGKLALMGQAERALVLQGFNDTAVNYPTDVLVHQLFERMAQQQPEAVALEYAGVSLSYDELNRRANQLAHYLGSLGAGPDARVAICVERSVEMVVGLLGILKAGAGYVPLDPGYPADRLAYMLDDCAPMALLTQDSLAAGFGDLAMPVIALDMVGPLLDAQAETNPAPAGLAPSHLAYVIYTSGSTGMPKGVMNEHAGVVNRLLWAQETYQLDTSDRVLQKTPFGFDVSVWEFFLPLLAGARLVMARPQGHQDPVYLAQLILDAGITTLHFVPSMLQQFLQLGDLAQCQSLRRVLCSGEALPHALQMQFHRKLPGLQLHNLYGPTEAAIDVTAIECLPGAYASIVPIGRPIANTQIYILDRHLQPVPLGVSGEIYIAGANVARGYLNKPEMTAERFIADPFSAKPGARMYKTGDLGRWLEDGNVDYLGRNDFQVKLRGLRIELGEIETRLLACAGVREAVVLAREDNPGDMRLVAYLVGEQLDAATLRAELEQSLAEYMLPSAFVMLDAFPLSQNGKLERKALPAPDMLALAGREYEAPQGEAEQMIARIWQELLGVERIGRHDHFFELGGHSLMAISLIEKLRRQGLSADVRSVFTAPTLSGMAALMFGAGASVSAIPPNLITPASVAITPEMLPLIALNQEQIDRIVGTVAQGVPNIQDIYPLAPLQTGMLFHHLLEPDRDAYLKRTTIGFDSRQRLDGFIDALQTVIARHDILRTAIVWEGLSQPVQVVYRAAPMPLHFPALDAGRSSLEQLAALTDPQLVRIDVQDAPLLRAYAAPDAKDGSWHLVLVNHHLVCDHVTLQFIIGEIQLLLAGRAADLPPVQAYRNFIAATLQADTLDHEAYFREQLGDIDEPTAPFGLLNVRGNGEHVIESNHALPEALALQIRAAARRHGVTPAILFHLAWAQVLGHCCAREEVVFGTVLSGRLQGADGADKALGMFINTLPVRLSLAARSVSAALADTYLRLSSLLEHEQASLSVAQRCSGVMAPAPLFTSLFNYRHAHDFKGEDVEAARRSWEGITTSAARESTNYPMTLAVDDLGQGFSLEMQCDGIDPDRLIGMMCCAIDGLSAALLDNPDQPLADAPLLSAAELRKVLVEFNDTATPFPQDRCFHQLFEEQVQRTPEAIALVYEDDSVTYAELNRRANRYAHYLLALGVEPDERVGLFVERSIDMFVGLLAIVKAGCAYVPIDPVYPAERVGYTLKDSDAVAVLTHASLRDRLPWRAKGVVVMDQSANGVAACDDSNLDAQAVGVKADNLMYVIYTSGSTGLPKGVMVEHRQVANFWVGLQDRALRQVPPQARVSLNASTAFDASLQAIVQLLSGHSIYLMPQAVRADGRAFVDFIERHRIDVFDCTPPQLEVLLHAGLEQIERPVPMTALVGGDALAPGAWKRLQNCRSFVSFNVYGPTECTVESTIGCLQEMAVLPTIGRPLTNTQLYILDANFKPVSIGVEGELYISGAGLARGYLNRPELTAERFIANPFAAPGVRMYKTGDVGRWMADGTIEYAGRNDFQVKVRGYRIELGEIEVRLMACDGVRDARVIAREDTPGEKRLVAYLVAVPGVALDAAQLRDALAEDMPEYMVPCAFVTLPAFPLTSSGKLDRKALPLPDQSAVATRQYQAPQGTVEQAVADVWKTELGLEQVGRQDHFFELGGHSLMAVRIATALSEALGMEVPLVGLFKHPTLEGFAAFLAARAPASNTPNLVTIRQDGAQSPLFFVHDGSGGLGYVHRLMPVLEAGFPVHGLMASGLADANSSLPASVEEMASDYLRQIRSVQPHGPYRLAGYSGGGTICYEMANQLRGADESVEFLGLIDTRGQYASSAPADPVALTGDADLDALLDLLGQVRGMAPGLLDELRALGINAGVPALFERVRAEGWIPADTTLDLLRRFLVVAKGISGAAERYGRPVITVPMVLFSASGNVQGDAASSWAGRMPRHSKVVETGGDHFTMLTAPYVETIGQVLSAALCQASPLCLGHDERNYEPIITIQAGRAGEKPVFCVPGAGASVTVFTSLVQELDQAVPLYGLQPRGFCGKLSPHVDVESAARSYLQAVRALDPVGPYRLVGHSFGGWVAFEMALQLLADGAEIELLVVLDSQAPFERELTPRYTREEMLMRLIGLFELSASEPMGIKQAELEELGHEAQLRLLLTRLIDVKLMHARTSVEVLRGLVRVFETNVATTYVPGAKYGGPLYLVDVIEGRSGPGSKSEREVRGWIENVAHVTCWTAPGNHVTLLSAPHVRQLARRLQPLMTRTRAMAGALQ